jgi:hypothetical protein
MYRLTVMNLAAELAATHADWPRKVCILAARYYLGVDTDNFLDAAVKPLPCNRDWHLPPYLTPAQAAAIRYWR